MISSRGSYCVPLERNPKLGHRDWLYLCFRRMTKINWQEIGSNMVCYFWQLYQFWIHKIKLLYLNEIYMLTLQTLRSSKVPVTRDKVVKVWVINYFWGWFYNIGPIQYFVFFCIQRNYSIHDNGLGVGWSASMGISTPFSEMYSKYIEVLETLL